MSTVAETVLAPMDALRLWALRASRPLSARLARDRSRRVLSIGLSSVVLSFAMAAWRPALLLTFGPLLLGVPHLASDVRCLVLRPALHRRRRLVALALPGLLICAASGSIPHGMSLGVGLTLTAISLAAEASPVRRLLALIASIAVGALLWALEPRSLIVLAHLHNVVALVLWWRLRPRSPAMIAIPAAVLFGTLAIALGAVGPDPVDARWSVSFAFLQSVHYAIWLRLVPEDTRPRETPRTFRASWNGLVRDFGTTFMLGVVALSIAFVVGAGIDPASSGSTYFRLAAFHGPLEFGALLLARLEGRRP